MGITDYIKYTGIAAAIRIFSSENTFAGPRNLTIRDTQNPRRVYTIEKLIDDSELNQPWVFKDPVTDAPLSGIEIYIDNIHYGTSDQNGEILRPTGIEEIVNQ